MRRSVLSSCVSIRLPGALLGSGAVSGGRAPGGGGCLAEDGQSVAMGQFIERFQGCGVVLAQRDARDP